MAYPRRYPIAEGLGQLIAGISQGLAQRSIQSSLSNLYDQTLKRLTELVTPPNVKQEDVYQNGELTKIGKYEPDYSQINPRAGLKTLYEAAPEFLSYGNAGNTYLNLLSKFYESSIPQETPAIYKEIGNTLLRIRGGQVEPVYTVAREEKSPKKTLQEYGQMGLQEVLSLPPDEIENSFFYLSPAVQEELKKNPYFQQISDKFFKQGDFQKIKTGRRGIRSRGPSFSFTQSTPEELANLTPEDLEKKNVSQLKQLWQNANLLSAETFDALAEKLNKPRERVKSVEGEDEDIGIDEPKEATRIKEFSEEEIRQVESDMQGWANYLADVYRREQAGELPQGAYNEVKLQFYQTLDYWRDIGIISEEDYNLIKSKYY